MPEQQVYLDEDVPRQLGKLLKDEGVVVHLPQEIETIAAADPIHLRECASHGWVLITNNRRDFRRLHWLWMVFHYWGVIPNIHSGILTTYEASPLLPVEWASAILDLLGDQVSLCGLMFMWRRSSKKWEPQSVAFM